MLEKQEIQYEKVILVGLITKDQDEIKSAEYLDELAFLAYTAGGQVARRFTQNLTFPIQRLLSARVRWKKSKYTLTKMR